MARATVAAAVAVAGLVAASGRALAHGDGSSAHAWLGPAAFLAGVALASVAVALDARDAVDPGRADLGVFAGVALAVVGVGTYFVL